MKLMTVSEVSKLLDVSTRMLRYYEKIGLITSSRKDGYAYRIYDPAAIRRLQQILLLRKLRIPLKQIATIIDDEQQVQSLQILQQNIASLSMEIDALSTIRDVLDVFAKRLDASIREQIHIDLISDDKLIKVVQALSPLSVNLKEDISMEKLSDAQKVLEANMTIRVLYLPPATVAAYQYIGENPEAVSGQRIADFVRAVNLPALKPDFKQYGFNNPSPAEGQAHYGYEFYVTIPEDLPVPTPLIKKQFAGGLYAAHCIKMGDFHEWGTFLEQVNASTEYDVDWREPHGMGGCMEEHLNAYSLYTDSASEIAQLDLLIPLKAK